MFNYIQIVSTDFPKDVKNIGGVYKIYSLDNQKKPIAINRILSTDSAGILYIGQTIELSDRLKMLKRVLDPLKKADRHTFGVNYNSLPNLMKAFPLESLYISYEYVDDPVFMEKELIGSYRQKFGEVPPLNHSK